MKIFQLFCIALFVGSTAFTTNALAADPCIEIGGDPTTAAGTMECLIGRDAAYIQALIVSAIEQTPANETARVDLPVNPRTGTHDWYFTARGIGIAIPRSNFILNGRDPADGRDATFHINVNGGGYLGSIIYVGGLQLVDHKFLGFSPDKTYLFPESEHPNSSVEVKFEWYPNANYPWLRGDSPVVLVKSISKGHGTNLMVENVTVKNITIEHDHRELSPALNSVAVEYANNVTIDNVKVINSPQTSFAIVSGANPSTPTVPAFPVTNVTLRNCSAVNSYNEAFRVIFYGNGTPKITASIEGSSAVNSGPTFDANQMPFTVNRKIHVYYRAWGSLSSLSISNSNFDSSAAIGSLSASPNLSITNSVISGGITLLGDTNTSPASASIVGNVFNCYYAKPGTSESCVYISSTPGVNLKANRISGNRNAWYSSDTPVTDKCNYWLNADGTPYYYSLSTGTNQTCP